MFLDEWLFICFDNPSDAWSTRPDAANVGDFVIGFLAQDPFGWLVELVKFVTDCVLVFARHQPVVAQIMSLTVKAS